MVKVLVKKPKRSGTDALYAITVVSTISLVIVGWFFTVRKTILTDISSAKSQVGSVSDSFKEQLQQTRQESAPFINTFDRVTDEVAEIIKEKEAQEQKVIESVVEKIQNQYAKEIE